MHDDLVEVIDKYTADANVPYVIFRQCRNQKIYAILEKAFPNSEIGDTFVKNLDSVVLYGEHRLILCKQVWKSDLEKLGYANDEPEGGR